MSKGFSQALPWRPEARAAAAAEARLKHGVDPRCLGIDEPFTDGELRRIDDRLGVPAELCGPRADGRPRRRRCHGPLRRADGASDVTMSAEAGQITGLIGPNGAGKTTFFNVITGLQSPQSGRVVLGGRDLTNTSAYKRARLGLARTFQRLEVFDSLSVRDNILVAAESSGDTREIDRVIGLVGPSPRHRRSRRHVAYGDGSIGRAVPRRATKPKVLLCDECSSGLTDEETGLVGDVIRRVAAEGVAVLLVEHDMSFVMGTCDVIHVLNLGVKIAEGHTDRDPGQRRGPRRIPRHREGRGGAPYPCGRASP